eukprot:5662498-Amphidinium_carterae.1
MKKQKFSEAVPLYEKGISVLDKADGHPMLRVDAEKVIQLKVAPFKAVPTNAHAELWTWNSIPVRNSTTPNRCRVVVVGVVAVAVVVHDAFVLKHIPKPRTFFERW